MAIAYNALLRSANAALAASGYRVARGTDHHHIVIQSLALTVAWAATNIKRVDQFRKKRNLAGYERAGLVSNEEATEMVGLAKQLHRDVTTWMKAHHSELA